MAHSGIIWVDWLFNLAVRCLVIWADIFGITYEEINVWLFCILWPLLTICMALYILVLRRRYYGFS
jgi:hypothetical protein